MKFNVFEQFYEFLDKFKDEEEENSGEIDKNDPEEGTDSDETSENIDKLIEIAKNEGVSPRGSDNPRVALIGASPSKVDVIRGKIFAGSINKTLEEHYLTHLDVGEDEIVLMNMVPVYLEDVEGKPREPTQDEIAEWAPYFKKQLEELTPQVLVALGTTARDGLENIFSQKFDETIDEFVPHPRAIAIHGDSGEIERKFKRLNKTLELLEDAEVRKSDEPSFKVTKVDDELQVVKGIVLEPGIEDADGNWSTRKEIEKAAHRFLKEGEMAVKREHMDRMDDAHIVESHIQEEDTVINGEEVRAGSWIAAIKVEDPEEWKLVKSGRYEGFSFGGRAMIDPSLRLQ